MPFGEVCLTLSLRWGEGGEAFPQASVGRWSPDGHPLWVSAEQGKAVLGKTPCSLRGQGRGAPSTGITPLLLPAGQCHVPPAPTQQVCVELCDFEVCNLHLELFPCTTSAGVLGWEDPTVSMSPDLLSPPGAPHTCALGAPASAAGSQARPSPSSYLQCARPAAPLPGHHCRGPTGCCEEGRGAWCPAPPCHSEKPSFKARPILGLLQRPGGMEAALTHTHAHPSLLPLAGLPLLPPQEHSILLSIASLGRALRGAVAVGHRGTLETAAWTVAVRTEAVMRRHCGLLGQVCVLK